MSSVPLFSNKLSIIPLDRVDAPTRRNGKKCARINSESEETIRQRNASKSRRSYHRRELELLSLREHVRVGELRNKALRDEQARLEALLAMTQEFMAS